VPMFSASDFICFPLAPWEQVIRFGGGERGEKTQTGK